VLLRRRLAVLVAAAMLLVVVMAASAVPAYANAGGMTPSGEQKAPYTLVTIPSHSSEWPPQPSPVPGEGVQQTNECFYNPDALPYAPEGTDQCLHLTVAPSGVERDTEIAYFRQVPGHVTTTRYEFVCDPVTGQCDYVLVSAGGPPGKG
jgi:hypothetical protein